MRLLLLLLAPLLATAQTTDHIQAIESGLLPSVILKDHPAPRHTIQQRMKALNVNGVGVAVIRNYRIAWAKGYGLADVAAGRPVTTDTLFLAGSISKPVAATGALQLVEQKKITLDEHVNQHLKSWKLPENDFTKDEKVTVRRILSHMAGLTVHGFPGYASGAALPTIPQILDGEKPANTPAVRVDLTPGSNFRYSGGGYTILQLMMADVTQTPFTSYMQTAVLNKANMRQSTYENPLPQRLSSVSAAGYKANGEAIPGRFHTYPEMAAAGLWTTASDLARFVIAIQRAHQGQPDSILKQSTAREMLTLQNKVYGLGFVVNDHDGVKWFRHGGADAGFQAILMGSTGGEGIVVMTNSENGSRVAQEIAYAAAAAYGWPDKPRERAAITLPTAELAKFAGEYEAPRIGKVTIRVEQDHLVANVLGPGDIDLYPQSADTFFSLGVIPDLKFTPDGFTAGGVTAKRRN
ncbi:MAG: serine hydrolase [Acidobacteria bacterium]|nr:serine hydrolase [Acidobacteriota bacterium]